MRNIQDKDPMKFLISDDVRRPIGVKILGIIFVIILMMCIVTLSSNYNLKKLNEELAILSEYYIPLDQSISDFRLTYFSQRLNFERILSSGSTQGLESARQEGIKITKQINSCSREEMREARNKVQQMFSSVGQQRMANYELQRFCTDKRVDDSLKLAERALTLPIIKKDPELVEKFTKMQMHLSNIPKLRDSLHVSIIKFLSEIHQNDPSSLQILKEQLDANSRMVGQETGSIAHLLHIYTREASAKAKSLESQASWFNWGMTIAAGLLGLTFAVLLTHNLVQPLRQLLTGAKAIVEKGDFDTELKITTADEIALLAKSFNHMVSALKAKELIRETFGQYVDPRIVDKLLDQGFQKGEKQRMTIFFSDIQSFTHLSERLTPAGIVALLNGYISSMAKSIHNNEGIIDKYIGDAIMAFWGPPFTTEKEHAELACFAALDQQSRLEEFRKTIPDLIYSPYGLPKFNVRMGICTGDVIVGSIGADLTKSYTVIGDTVNVAARLEAANKHYGTRIVISEITFRMAKDKIEARELDTVRVIGKNEPIRIYELLGRKGEVDPVLLDARNHFEKGLDLYRKRDFVAAKESFNACLKIRPEDPPSRLFVHRIEVFQSQPLSNDWNGIWNLRQK